jgi:hypothetical protein
MINLALHRDDVDTILNSLRFALDQEYDEDYIEKLERVIAEVEYLLKRSNTP